MDRHNSIRKDRKGRNPKPNVLKFKAGGKKPTWVFVAGTYRTASTTQYCIARDIVEETHSGIGIGYHQESKLRDFDVPSPHRYVVCKVFEFLPNGFQGQPSVGQIIYQEERLRVLATIRDPRDIITSMQERHKRQMEDPRHMRGPFDFEERVTVDFPRWLGQLEDWINLGPEITLTSRYEEFTQDLVGEVRRISRHLGLLLEDKNIRKIALRYTTDAIQERKLRKRKASQKEDPWLPSIPGILFGKSGTYQDHLTPKEIELVEEANGEWMRKFGYL